MKYTTQTNKLEIAPLLLLLLLLVNCIDILTVTTRRDCSNNNVDGKAIKTFRIPKGHSPANREKSKRVGIVPETSRDIKQKPCTLETSYIGIGSARVLRNAFEKNRLYIRNE